jgi:hypothetical protein
MDIRPLCYGDEIRLILGPEGGFMGAEGVLDSECRLLRSDIPRMDRAIFRIIIPYQYSAAKELKEYIADRLAEGLDAESDPEDSQLRALTRGKLNEDKQNETAVQVGFQRTKHSPSLPFPPLLVFFSIILFCCFSFVS